MKQALLPLLAVIIIITVLGLFTKNPAVFKSIFGNSPTPTSPAQTIKSLTINNKKINLEIANTYEARAKGLGGRKSIDGDSGMLFVFESKQVTASFWMKDMLIPIDMIWISGGEIIRIDKNAPFYPPGTPDNQLKIYSPGQPVDYVLETSAGFSQTKNVKVGDSVDLSEI